MSHTPGPWRQGKGYYSVVADTLAPDSLKGSDEIEAYGGCLIAESVAPSNMPLIAAAPVLYDTLKEVLDQVAMSPRMASVVKAALALAEIKDRALEIANCPDCQACCAHAYSDATTPGFFYDKCEKHRQPGIQGAAGVVIQQEMTIDEARRRFPSQWSDEHLLKMADAESEALDATGGLLAVSPEIYALIQRPVTLNIPDKYPWEEKADESGNTNTSQQIPSETRAGDSGDPQAGIQRGGQSSGEDAGVEKLEGSGNRRKQPSQAKIEALQKIPGVTTAAHVHPSPRCKKCGAVNGKHKKGCKEPAQ